MADTDVSPVGGRANADVSPVARRAKGECGVTLIEAALIMTVTAAIIGALAPVMTVVVRHAEIAAAQNAMANIRMQLLACLADMNYSQFTVDGSKNGTKVQRVVSDGDIPREASGAGDASWQAAVDNVTGLTDFLERHLVTNNPRGNAANAYSPSGAANDWDGAYLNAPVDPDPWGNRYVVNVQFLGSGAGNTNDVVVYSAGPDETIDSPYQANPLTVPAGADDLIDLVES